MAFKDVLRTAFPFLSAAASVGGPLGALAASAVGKALGVDVAKADALTDVISRATSMDPDAVFKVRQAENQFQLQMAQLGFDSIEKLEEVAAKDRADARAREVAVRDKVPALLAMTVTGGFFALLAILAWHDIPKEAHDLLLTMVGVLGTAWIGIITYYFGSSSGSADKSRTIENLKVAQSK